MEMLESFNPLSKMAPSKLRDFLTDSKMSVPRERVFSYRIFSDLKIASAHSGYHLQLYEPDVDRDGHDVIFEDEVRISSQQLKVVCGTTNQWKIKVRHLLPDAHYAKNLGFSLEVESPDLALSKLEGAQGGVILIEPTLSKEGYIESITYSYCDIFVLFARHFGLFQTLQATRQSISRSIEVMQRSRPDSHIKLQKGYFLRSRSPETLLALMGLQSRYQSTWRLDVIRLVQKELDPRLIGDENEQEKRCVGQRAMDNLSQLVDQS